MNAAALTRLFNEVRAKKLSPDEAVQRLRHLPFEDLGFAKIDHHRALRQGMPEVIFGQGKTPAQVAKIFVNLAAHNEDGNILATRATEEQFQAVRAALAESADHQSHEKGSRDRDLRHKDGQNRDGQNKDRQSKDRRNQDRQEKIGQAKTTAPNRARLEQYLAYRPEARAITLHRDRKLHGKGVIAVVSAGTSDIPVAEEAVVTAELMGNRVQHLYDVGVAGIHRLLAHRSVLAEARVIIVCAGMEGALPSVVGGLVGVPVIAVPTSIGYGAAFEGLAALLGMLNSCASNVSVVNIDNGFGAAYVASLINRE
jgi:pyridinium-3,5-biscarboxylic acid mononucleotide synthase